MDVPIRNLTHLPRDMVSRKRPAPPDRPLLHHVTKKHRAASLDTTPIVPDSEFETDEEEIEHLFLHNSSNPTKKSIRRDQSPSYLRGYLGRDQKTYPAYDPDYFCGDIDAKLSETSSLLVCSSPHEALIYFKSQGKDVRRRIKNVEFSQQAMTFGPSQNGTYWNGFCNYIRRHMCIESITIHVPFDPAVTLYDVLHPDPLSLMEFRRQFDWRILSQLSRSLVMGATKQIKLLYPTMVQKHNLADFKAVQAVQYHSSKFASEHLIKCPRCKYASNNSNLHHYFNLGSCHSQRSDLGSVNVVLTIAKVFHYKQTHPRCSFLGLPRELRDMILKMAVSAPDTLWILSTEDYFHSCPPLRPRLLEAYQSLSLTNRQLSEEASRLVFKERRLVFDCTVEEAYSFLALLPGDILVQIRSLELHNIALHHRHYWLRLSRLITNQMAVQEVILPVPYDPSFPNALADSKTEHSSEEDSNDSDSDNDDDRNKAAQLRTIIENWQDYWWPGAKLMVKLLMDGAISRSIKFRYGTSNYLERCGIKDSVGLNELKLIAELRYPHDLERYMRKAVKQLDVLRAAGLSLDEIESLSCWKNLHDHVKKIGKLNFEVEMGEHSNGDQLVVLKRRPIVTWNGPLNTFCTQPS